MGVDVGVGNCTNHDGWCGGQFVCVSSQGDEQRGIVMMKNNKYSLGRTGRANTYSMVALLLAESGSVAIAPSMAVANREPSE